MNENRKVVLILGKPTNGKSFALQGMDNQNRTAYLNADIKDIPFKHNFKHNLNVTDPALLPSTIYEINDMDDIDFIVLDTVTKLMSNYERTYVLTATNTMQAWGDYGKFYGDVIHALKSGSKNVAVMGHVKDILNEKEMILETACPVKGAVGHVGVEADFSIILTARRMKLTDLEGFENKYLNITDDNKRQGFKYVLQTENDANTMGEKTRSPYLMWKPEEKYIDNNLSFVFERINEYYSD